MGKKMMVEVTLHGLETKLAEVTAQNGCGSSWNAVTSVNRAREPKRLWLLRT
jgi:hypothetical protein